MKLQILSDLHLEFSPNFYPPKIGNMIALLGDIGYPKSLIYKTFITRLSKDYEHVFLITGNHEYYNKQSSYEKINSYLKDFTSDLNNVHFLNNESYTIENTIFLGSTLWSHIPPHRGFSIMRRMNDYWQITKDNSEAIKNSNRWHQPIPISFKDTNLWHQMAVDYITKQIDLSHQSNKNLVVLTHHCPLLDGTSRDNDLKYAYGSDLTYLFRPLIKVWAHGHTHISGDQMVNSVRVVSNPRGYPGENTGFKTDFYIDI